MAGGNEEEIDFSSYLVDLDDEASSMPGLGGARLSQEQQKSLLSSFSDPLFTGLHSEPSNPTAVDFPPSVLGGVTANQDTNTTPTNNLAASASATTIHKPLRTHSAKNWSGALLVRSVVSSPSPPESTSESSYKASISGSGSAPSTAASSVASTSYPSSTGSWMTQKGVPHPAAPPSAESSSSPLNLTPPASLPTKGSTDTLAAETSTTAATSSNEGSTKTQKSSISASRPNSSNLNLSFAYDFAHDPSSTTTTTTAPGTQATTPSSASALSNNIFNNVVGKSHMSMSLPAGSGEWFKGKGERGHTRRGSTSIPTDNGPSKGASHPDDRDRVLAENTLLPSSGPTKSSAKTSRSRQASSISISGGISPMTATSLWPSSTTSSSLNSKPYARPPATLENAPSTAPSTQPDSSSGSSSSNLKRNASKRKTASTGDSATAASSGTNFSLLPDNSTFVPPPLPKPTYTPVASYALPSPSYLHRDQTSFPLGAMSPASPALDGFSTFPNSSVNSPASYNHPSVASTPGESILSAITAPSPFDPRNFSNLNINPLTSSEEHAASAFGFSPSYSNGQQTSNRSSTGKTPPVDVDKAVALAGIGGKWFNWASQQNEGQDSATTTSVLSNVLQEGFSNSAASPSAAAVAGTVTSPPYMRGMSAAPGAGPNGNTPGSGNNSSVGSPDWAGTIDGESPEALAARDPLATHLWRLYAKAKAGLPSGARMENITWRMMSLKLHKQRQASLGENAATPDPAISTATMNEKAPNVDQDVQAPAPIQNSVASRSSAAVANTHEERGRRGRSVESASPQESGEVAEMDWRKASRSRSRAADVRDMDWRAQSRSRSRAPNMRISIPVSSGFHVDHSTAQGEFHQSHQYQTSDLPGPVVHPSTTAGTAPTTGKDGEETSKSIEDTLKFLIASNPPASAEAASINPAASTNAAILTDSMSPSNSFKQHPQLSQFRTQPTPFQYVPPAPLPMPPGQWLQQDELQKQISESATGLQYQDLTSSLSSIPSADLSSDLSQSKQSISQSVEAYLSTLGYSTSIIDLPGQRHSGSIPGLFHEQDLKANQHADYGYLPRLVRKTSFDASYPASLQHLKNTKQGAPVFPASSNTSFSTASGVYGGSQSAASTPPYMPNNMGGYFKTGVAHSTPGTPTLSNLAFTPFALSQQPGSVTHPSHASAAPSPSASDRQGQQGQFAANSQSAAMEAFRRLQAAQALQAANASQAQQSGYASYVDSGFANGAINMNDPLALLSQHMNHASPGSMHINPSQVLGTGNYAGNPFSGINGNESDFGGSPWGLSPQGTLTPSPGTAAASPDESYGRDLDKGSYGGSNHSSIQNLHHLGTSLTDDSVAQSPALSQNKKGHNKSASISAPSNEVVSNGGAIDGAPVTVCINCKTTNTPLWRRDENGQPLCNACQLFRKLHGSDRPVSLHNSVIKKRNRTRNKADAPKKTGARTQSRRNSTTANASSTVDTTANDS